jgi:hypothetical protein
MITFLLHLRVLFVLVVLAHHRRRVVCFNVTEDPTARGTAQQIVDAFPRCCHSPGCAMAIGLLLLPRDDLFLRNAKPAIERHLHQNLLDLLRRHSHVESPLEMAA